MLLGCIHALRARRAAQELAALWLPHRQLLRADNARLPLRQLLAHGRTRETLVGEGG